MSIDATTSEAKFWPAPNSEKVAGRLLSQLPTPTRLYETSVAGGGGSAYLVSRSHRRPRDPATGHWRRGDRAGPDVRRPRDDASSV